MKRLGALVVVVLAVGLAAPRAVAARPGDRLERIGVSDDGRHFVGAKSGKTFIAWGFNYTHNRAGKLIEDFWADDWATLAGDFREMKALGANIVRNGCAFFHASFFIAGVGVIWMLVSLCRWLLRAK